MIDLSVMLGRMLSPAPRAAALARDVLLRGAAVVPGARERITQMRFKPRPRYHGASSPAMPVRPGFLVSAACSSSRWSRRPAGSG